MNNGKDWPLVEDLNSLREKLLAKYQKFANIRINFKTAFSCKKRIDSFEKEIMELYEKEFIALDKKIGKEAEQRGSPHSPELRYLNISIPLNLRNSLDNLFNVLFSDIENAKMRTNSYISLIIALIAVIISFGGVIGTIILHFVAH